MADEQPPAANLVANGDFSGPGDGAREWKISGHGVRVRGDKGERVLYFPAKEIAEKERVTQALKASDFHKGQSVRLACEVRFPGPPEKAGAKQGLVLKLVGESKKPILEKLLLSSNAAGEWQTREREFVIPEEIEKATLVIETHGRLAEMEIRNIRLQTVAPKDSLVLFSLMRPGLRIDGGDPGLKTLQKAYELVKTTGLEAASLATECRSAYDREAVVFFLEMQDSQPGGPGRDGVEVWLSPRGDKYYQFIIGREGQLQTFLRTPGSAVPIKLSSEATVGKGKSGWSVRLRVPFSDLETGTPADNARWGFNVVRNGLAKDGAPELSSWARVSALEQTKLFGKLAFYSRAEVEADLDYWHNNDQDPLLRRASVSGLEIAKAREGMMASQPASFWSYDPYAADRKAEAAWGCRGLTDRLSAKNAKTAKADYPAFFDIADRFNRSLLALAKAGEAVGSLDRARSYLHREASGELAGRLTGIQSDLDLVFKKYSAAFKADWNAALLEGADASLSKITQAIEAVQSDARKALGSLQDEQRKKKVWNPLDTEIDPADERRNQDGVPQRYWFSVMRSYGTDPLDRYFGEFRSFNIDWPHLVAASPAPGQFSLPNLDASLGRLASNKARFNFQTTIGLESYQCPSPEWVEKEIAADPAMLAATADRLEMPSGVVPNANLKMALRTGINIEHPKVTGFAKDYLSHVVREANRTNQVDFVVTGWEDSMWIKVRPKGAEAKVKRRRGYDPVSQQAFRDYLRERYQSIAVLKEKWKVSRYGDFSDITPPDDYYLAPGQPAGGLTYEWGRWQRKSHFNWAAMLRKAAKEGAPGVSVMTDNSHLLSAGTANDAMEGPSADIISFHHNPSDEDAMFAYLGSLARRKGITLGCLENYCMMYSRLEGEDERLAKLSLRRHLHDFAARDVRMLTFWIQYVGNPTPYVAAYGGGMLRLDNDQTILRWPTTEIVEFMDRIKRVERPLVESVPVKGKIAVIVPDSSNIQLPPLYGKAGRPGSEMAEIVDFQNKVLSEANVPAEYIHEDVLAETGEDLSSYDAVFIANAPFIRQEALQKLSAWSGRPGTTLFVAGPLGYFNELGADIAAEQSPLRSGFPNLSLDPGRPWQLKEGETRSDLLEQASVGRGLVVRLAGSIGDFIASPPHLKKLQEAVKGAVARSASLAGEQIRFQERRGTRGETYLLISNRDVQMERTFELSVDGRFGAAYDLLIPGWFPVPPVENGGRTKFSGTLAPGDWTLLKLEPAHSGPKPADHSTAAYHER